MLPRFSNKNVAQFVRHMIVYGCQLNIVWEDKAANFASVQSLLGKRKLARGSLIILPEMFATGFTMNVKEIAEPMNGHTMAFLRQQAVDSGSYVLGGIARRAGQKVFNEAVCVAPAGECVARYAKLHPFGPGGESDHYSAGSGLSVFQCGGLKVALFICYDLRFPEAFRASVAQGAEAMIVIANWPSRRHMHWTALLKARAIENQAYVIGINRCGHDPKLDYAGGSVVFDPCGKIVSSAGSKESILSARLDPALPSRCRADFPVLKDIRSDFLKIANGRENARRRSRSRVASGWSYSASSIRRMSVKLPSPGHK
jgi:omega-amidase